MTRRVCWNGTASVRCRQLWAISRRELAARAEVVQRAVAVAEPLAEAGKAGADEHDAVGVVAFLRDDRFLLGRVLSLAGQPLVVAGPVVVAVGAELSLCDDALELLVVEPLEDGDFAQVRGERAFAVDAVDVVPQVIIKTQQVAQPLPADFQQFRGIADREDGGGA